MKWSYGVTTVPSRLDTTLPDTLSSLHKAGFENPRLFVDGASEGTDWTDKVGRENVSFHYPPLHAFGNFWLGLLELYLREPLADLFAVFQDDILVCMNTRQYLDVSIPATLELLGQSPNIPRPVYFNLFTCLPNENLIRTKGVGWHPSNQLGWGGQALVFPRDTMLRMFQSKHLVERPLGMRNGVPDPVRAWKNLDGGVCASVKSVGGVEVVHYPSLVHHIDCPSAIGNGKDGRMKQGTWPGEDFDALSWLGPKADVKPELAAQLS